jgi:hypothetical protein
MWDLDSIEFTDSPSFWSINNGFLVNGAPTAETSQELQNLQFQTSEYFRNVPVSDKQSPPKANQLPVVFDMRNTWFTKIQRREESLQSPPSFPRSSISISNSATSPREPELVDDECRRGLSNFLVHPFPQEHLLPSSEFLVI